MTFARMAFRYDYNSNPDNERIHRMATLDELRAMLRDNARDKRIATVRNGEVEIKDIEDIKGQNLIYVAVSVDESLSGAWDMFLRLALDIAEAKTRSDCLEHLSTLIHLYKAMRHISTLREVRAHDCPHCKGPLPLGLDDTPQPNTDGRDLMPC